MLDLCADGQEFLDTASRFGVFAHGQSGTHTSLDGHVGAKDSQFNASSLDARAYDLTHREGEPACATAHQAARAPATSPPGPDRVLVHQASRREVDHPPTFGSVQFKCRP